MKKTTKKPSNQKRPSVRKTESIPSAANREAEQPPAPSSPATDAPDTGTAEFKAGRDI